jgi:sugar phosphate isomerase/epimerase
MPPVLILLQLKSSHKAGDLADIGKIIRKVSDTTGRRIRGHEVQQIPSIFNKTSVRKRAEDIALFCRSNRIEYLSYHAIIYQRGENLWDEKSGPTIRESIIRTAEEASMVSGLVGLENKVMVISHLTNYVPLENLPITRTEKFEMMSQAVQEYLRLVKNELAEYRDSCEFAVENSYPKYGSGFASSGPFHPHEFEPLQKAGIKTVLDLSHYTLYSNYLKDGRGNLCGDLDREIYSFAPDWKECAKMLSGSLALLHISDAAGYTVQGEGLPLGKGEIPLVTVLRELAALTGGTIQGTIELGEGHLNHSKSQLDAALWLIERLPEGVLAW